MSNSIYALHRGNTPLLISIPHAGTEIPPRQRPHYTERALQVEDTDWHLERLYDFAQNLGASTCSARSV